MRTIKKRLEHLEAHYAGKSLPDFEKMTPEQCEAWIKQATYGELDVLYRDMMVVLRGCKPWEVENMDILTDEELDTIMREAGGVITGTGVEVIDG